MSRQQSSRRPAVASSRASSNQGVEIATSAIGLGNDDGMMDKEFLDKDVQARMSSTMGSSNAPSAKLVSAAVSAMPSHRTDASSVNDSMQAAPGVWANLESLQEIVQVRCLPCCRSLIEERTHDLMMRLIDFVADGRCSRDGVFASNIFQEQYCSVVLSKRLLSQISIWCFTATNKYDRK